MELYRSQCYRNTGDGKGLNVKGPRGDFLLVCSWMLWCIHSHVETTNPLSEAEPEFGFIEPSTATP
jgi:hypothetical protein